MVLEIVEQASQTPKDVRSSNGQWRSLSLNGIELLQSALLLPRQFVLTNYLECVYCLATSNATRADYFAFRGQP